MRKVPWISMACSGLLQQPGTVYFPPQTLAQHQPSVRPCQAHRRCVKLGVSLEAAGDLSLEVEAHLTPPKLCHMGIDQGLR